MFKMSNKELLGLLIFIVLAIIAAYIGGVRNATLEDTKQKYFIEFYIGKLHYLKTDKGIINYTQDSIDFVNQTRHHKL